MEKIGMRFERREVDRHGNDIRVCSIDNPLRDTGAAS
jgi:hypothetical protein